MRLLPPLSAAVRIQTAFYEPVAKVDLVTDHVSRVACIFLKDRQGVCRIGINVRGYVSWQHVINASAPVLPGLERNKEFTL